MQCKYHSSPVGNSAVQQVHAAKSFYRASHAAVVTNASYTRGCVALASRTNVHLLSVNKLMYISLHL
ncbi:MULTISPECIES: restriction endonuclease [Tistrella]|uniref:restriction endonuclease n=1 Tax=Tistrella TaxID=171436 RepID=UPI0031F71743